MVARQAPLSMGFSRLEYWSGLPFPSPEDLPNLGIKPMSLAFPALASEFFTTAPPGKPKNPPPSLKYRYGLFTESPVSSAWHSPLTPPY